MSDDQNDDQNDDTVEDAFADGDVDARAEDGIAPLVTNTGDDDDPAPTG